MKTTVTTIIRSERLLLEDVVDSKANEVIVKSGKLVGAPNIKKLNKMSKSPKVEIDSETLIGAILANDIIDKETGEVMFESNTVITAEVLEQLGKKREADRDRKRAQAITWPYPPQKPDPASAGNQIPGSDVQRPESCPGDGC